MPRLNKDWITNVISPVKLKEESGTATAYELLLIASIYDLCDHLLEYIEENEQLKAQNAAMREVLEVVNRALLIASEYLRPLKVTEVKQAIEAIDKAIGGGQCE